MAERPVKNYDGNYITCYPGSNQQDDGKLNLEFNMARLVTRVSSKNFCTVEPSFELRLIRSNTGFPQIEVGTGQCSIDGRDLIMKQKLVIDAPEQAGTFYLALHLAKDPQGNVYGDEIYGVTKTFMGVYLTYYDTKPDPVEDSDILYLGKVVYDGTDILSLEEDPDKYGRIWAQDILAKINDWKHPNTERILLQEWIDKVPDWYVSKEGDVIYGALEFLAGRDPNVSGTSDDHEDIGTGIYGLRAEAIYNPSTNKKSTKIDIKAPDVLVSDLDKKITVTTDDTGFNILLGRSNLQSNTVNNYALDLITPNKINIITDSDFTLIGKTKTMLGSGVSGLQPQLLLTGNKATFSSSDSVGLVDETYFNGNTLQHKIGKTILQYYNSNFSILNYDTAYVNIEPNTDFKSNIRVKTKILLGNNVTYGNESSYLSNTELKLVNLNNSLDIIDGQLTLIRADDNNGYILIKKSNTAYSQLFNNAQLKLYNTDSNTHPLILLSDGTVSYNVSLAHEIGRKGDGTGTVGILNIGAGHTKLSGDLTVTGDVRANKVFNAVYNGFGEIFRKDKDEIIEYGDIVCIRSNGLVYKVSSDTDVDNIIGICSNTIGIQMGGKDIPVDEQVEVEMIGQIWVKTDNNEIKPGQWVKALNNGKCDITDNKYDKLGITLTNVIDGKVRIVYNG